MFLPEHRLCDSGTILTGEYKHHFGPPNPDLFRTYFGPSRAGCIWSYDAGYLCELRRCVRSGHFVNL